MANKDAMIDAKGAPITQGLFLETSYANTDNVQYTLKGRDYTYKGKKLPSIKRLFLEMEDPTEYDFAYEYFLDWDHWQRIKKNKLIAVHLEGWADELELRLRAQAVRDIIDMSSTERSFQSAKWLADRGWEKRAPGRPTKEEKVREQAMQVRIADEFKDDLARLK
jgi:hypothetical protein